MGEAGFFGFFLSVGAMAVALLVGPIGEAIARRISGDKKEPASGGVSTGEMAAERVVALENRVQELEERLDFTERMLLKGGAEDVVSENTPR